MNIQDSTVPHGEPLDDAAGRTHPSEPPLDDAAVSTAGELRFNCLHCLLLPLIPLALTLLAVWRNQETSLTAFFTGLITSIATGTLAGAMLGQHLGRSTLTRFLLGIVFTALMIVVCVILTVGGVAIWHQATSGGTHR